jgi:hypothetical protein
VGKKNRAVRAIELSGTGIVLDQRRLTRDEEAPLFVHLIISLPERRRAIHAVARPVRSYGCQQALRFVEIADVDRLTLAEHLDVVQRAGTALN